MKISASTLVVVSIFYTAGAQTTWSPASGKFTCDTAGLTCTISGCEGCSSIASGFAKEGNADGSTTLTANHRAGSNVIQVGTDGSKITCDAGCVCVSAFVDGTGCFVDDGSGSGGSSPGMTAALSAVTASAVITGLFL